MKILISHIFVQYVLAELTFTFFRWACPVYDSSVNGEKLAATYTTQLRFSWRRTASHQVFNKQTCVNSPAVDSSAKHTLRVHSTNTQTHTRTHLDRREKCVDQPSTAASGLELRQVTRRNRALPVIVFQNKTSLLMFVFFSLK